MIQNYKILWFINSICNYKCDYCLNSNVFKKEETTLNDSYLKRMMLNIDSLGAEKYFFSLCGGEPTLEPKFFELITLISSFFQQKLANIKIFSNGSQPLSFWKRLIPHKDIITIKFSAHLQYYSERWYELLKFFEKNHLRCCVDIMLDLNNIEFLNNFILFLNSRKFQYISAQVKPIYKSTSVCRNLQYEKIKLINLKKKILLNIHEDNFQQPQHFENKKYCLVGSNKLILDRNGIMKKTCKNNNLTHKSIFFLTPQKFKEEILKIKMCDCLKCKHHTTIQPIRSNSFDELKKIRQRIIFGE